MCEYCLILETDRASRFQADHIISVKHGGLTTEDNFCCYACIFVIFKSSKRY
ncbi:HNH endonuclease [Chlorogloeopsis sp. ULAP02]|uniref:HNH endonuclease n=1 Tax=Chlorogloeopsis sp. ULAP02 TaxID=3107926 RepID=UPI0031352C1B